MGIFAEGSPHNLLHPMLEDGYGIQREMVDPDFATDLLRELKRNKMYSDRDAVRGIGPDARHYPDIQSRLSKMRRLGEYVSSLNQAITEVSGFNHTHLTYLTVRACPAGEEMSTNIHRNDNAAGPWLVTLTVAGSGSVNIYPDNVINYEGEEIALTGDPAIDPIPVATSPMGVGDAWGAYSLNWSAPHAGGKNTGGAEPKVLVLLYGWYDREAYIGYAASQLSELYIQERSQVHLPHGIIW